MPNGVTGASLEHLQVTGGGQVGPCVSNRTCSKRLASAAAGAATIGMLRMKLTHGFRRKDATLWILTPCLLGGLEGLCLSFFAAAGRRRHHIHSTAPHVPR